MYVAPTSKVAAAAEASPTAAAYALDVGAGVVGSMNTTPMLAAGFELLSRVSRGAFSLGLEARLDLPRAQTIEGGAIEGGLATATVPACARAGVLEGCALLTGGVERGTGAGYFDARQATVPYAAAGARGALEWPLARVALRLHADVAAQLVRPLFLIGNHAVWSAPAIAVLVGVDLAAHVR